MKLYIEPISKEALSNYLAISDLIQSSKPHAIKMVYEKISDYVRSSHPQSNVQVYRREPIVSVEDNYDNLLIPKDNLTVLQFIPTMSTKRTSFVLTPVPICQVYCETLQVMMIGKMWL